MSAHGQEETCDVGKVLARVFFPLRVSTVPKQDFVATEGSSGRCCRTLSVAGWVTTPKHTPAPAHPQLRCRSCLLSQPKGFWCQQQDRNLPCGTAKPVVPPATL